nr:hypothetical protein [Tanacetum cinerariifolium]
WVRSAKVSGRARERVDRSLVDFRGGKRVSAAPANDEISQVLSNIKDGNISHLKFDIGSSSDISDSLNKVDVMNKSINENDDSFIKVLLENFSRNEQGSLVAKSCGLKTSLDHSGMGDVGSGISNEHISIKDVVDTGVVHENSQDGIACNKGGRGFVFGKNEVSNGIFNSPVGPFFNVKFSNIPSSNPFVKKSGIPKDEKLKQGTEEIALKMEYVPNSVSKLENGNRRIIFSAKEVYKDGQSCALQLYGYFIGTTMDYRVVRGNLIRMWRVYDIEEITKTNFGIYYFKFKSEEGMKKVLESGPWLIQNVSIVLNVWEPGICGIGKIMSGVGKPLLMDNMTRERCLKKAGKIDFARVLVEVSAEDELPNILKIEYPPLVRPRTEEEIAAKTLRDVLKVGNSDLNGKGKSVDVNHGFTLVGRKNKPVTSQNSMSQTKSGGNNRWGGRVQSNVMQRNGNFGGKFNNVGHRRGGGLVQRNKFHQKSNFDAGSMKAGRKSNNNKPSFQEVNKKPMVDKPILASTFNHKFRPKVLVRGSGSAMVMDNSLKEDILVKNSFDVHNSKEVDGEDLGGINVNDEFNSKVWLKLKEEVDILMEAGIYPSKQVRLDWSIHQLDYFYKNCNKFHLDPICKDDEEDVESKVEGVAGKTHVKKKNLSRICNRVLGNWDWASNVSSCTGVDIRSLWKDLHKHKISVKDRPWVILGDFNACLDPSERSSGCLKPGMVGGLLKKLDRVLGNISFMTSFPSAFTRFLPFMLSDHTPAMFVIPEVKKSKHMPFKFHNYLSSKEDFIPTVKNVWSNKVEGIAMFSLVSKLKLLKKPLRKLNFAKGNLFDNVKRLRADLVLAQSAVCSDPHNGLLREIEAKAFKAYKSALRDEESFLKQKAKIQWLDEGEKNSKYFHNVIKGRLNKNIISYIYDLNGNDFHGNNVEEQFVKYFKNVLGTSSSVNPIDDPDSLFLSDSDAEYMIRSVTYDEIRKALFEIDGNKGPDGVLGFLVDVNQCAFIPSRQISDNILISHELMRGYRIDRGFVKCAFKVDIQKAYDSVEWEFLACCLKAIGFHDTLIRGLRQGDPISPYLFTLVMEVFNLVLKRQIARNPYFKYHWMCKEVGLTHLCVADDILLLCHGDSKSVSVLKKALDEFGGISGLLPNKIRSVVFFGNVKKVSRRNIMRIMPFNVGNLPARYLGVPLLSKRLYVKDCRLLIDKSVLSSMQVFWASLFILPKSIAADVERLLRDFIWNYGEFKRESLWVKWIYVYKLKGRSFWDISDKAGTSWAWKNLLRFRGKFRDHIVHIIGDGCNTSLWFDNWHVICPLSNFISRRDILYSGLSLDCKVANVIKNGGRIKDFSVSKVWNDIRSRNVLVPWSRLRDDDLCCVFCKEGLDSHNHLFFECDFPKEVWCRLKDLALAWCYCLDSVAGKKT